jgi:hypothetical protein
MSAYADADRFLASVKMDETRDQTVGEVFAGGVFERANFHHSLIEVEESIARDGRDRSLVSRRHREASIPRIAVALT